MSEEQQQPGRERRELNLNQIATEFMKGMQRHFDILSFNLAARKCVTEAAYVEQSSESNAMPVAQLHQNFEQMQAHARDLLLKQLLNDALNLTASALNNCHIFLAAASLTKELGKITPEANRELQEKQQEFVRAPFDKKFDLLESQYKIMCPLEDSIISLGFCLQVLVQQGGVVREGQLDESGNLVLELNEGVQGSAPSPNGIATNFTTFSKTYSAGDQVDFTDRELQCVLLTIVNFSHALFTSVARFAQENKGE